jgi:hypothetical protein
VKARIHREIIITIIIIGVQCVALHIDQEIHTPPFFSVRFTRHHWSV